MDTPYTLIRSARSTVSIQVRAGGELVVRAPHLYPRFLIDRFIDEKSAWIAKRRQELTRPRIPPSRLMTDRELELYVHTLVAHYSAMMGLHPAGIRFRSVTSYWGSCAASGLISFNRQLAYTKKEAIAYVVVHELAHLRWRGHGKRFWDLVERTFPRTNEIRRYLRQMGHDAA
jgi:hypothetical protein